MRKISPDYVHGAWLMHRRSFNPTLNSRLISIDFNIYCKIWSFWPESETETYWVHYRMSSQPVLEGRRKTNPNSLDPISQCMLSLSPLCFISMLIYFDLAMFDGEYSCFVWFTCSDLISDGYHIMILSLKSYPSFCYTVSDCLPAAIVVIPQQHQQQSASFSATPPAALLNTAAGSSSSAQGSASKAPLTRSLSHVLSASVSRELSLHAASAGPAAAGVTSPAVSSAGLLSLYPTPPLLCYVMI